MRTPIFFLICLLTLQSFSYSINLPQGDKVIALVQSNKNISIRILSSGGKTNSQPWALNYHHETNLKNKNFICFLNTLNNGISSNKAISIVYSNDKDELFLQPIHIPKIKQAQNLNFDKSLPLNIKLENNNERFISANFHNQYKRSIYKTKFINSSHLVLQEINLNENRNKSKWQFISTEIIQFSLNSQRTLLSIHSGDFYNQKRDHLCVISKDHQYVYYNWLILKTIDEKLQLHKNIEVKKVLNKHPSIFAVGDFYNCGRDLLLKVERSGQYTMQFAPEHPGLQPNPMLRILNTKKKIIESGHLFNNSNQNILYIQSLKKANQQNYFNKKSELELKNDIGIAFIRRSIKSKSIMSWPKKGTEIQFEIYIRNNSTQAIERNQVHLDIWHEMEGEDSNIHPLVYTQPNEIITIKRNIEVFNIDNYTKVFIKRKWPYSQIGSNTKKKWLIVQARYKDDNNLSNNRTAICWTGQQLPMYYDTAFSKSLLYSNDDPISVDYYLNKLAMAYTNIWHRGGINHNFHYVRSFEKNNDLKPFPLNHSKAENLHWQNFAWNDAKGDLKKLWNYFSLIKDYKSNPIYPSSFTQKHSKELFLINQESSLPLKNVTLPSKITKKLKSINGITPLPHKKFKHNNYFSEKIIFTLSDEQNKPIVNAKLRLLSYENNATITSGNTNAYGVWHSDLSRYNIDQKWNDLAHYTHEFFSSRTLVVEANYEDKIEYIPVQKGDYHGPLALYYASLLSNPAIIELKSHAFTTHSPQDLSYQTSVKDELLSINIHGKDKTKIELLEKFPHSQKWFSLRHYTYEGQNFIIPIHLNKSHSDESPIRQFAVRKQFENKNGPLTYFRAMPFKSATAITKFKNGFLIPTSLNKNNSCIQHYEKTLFKNFILNIDNEKVRIKKIIPSKLIPLKFYCLLKHPYKKRRLVAIHTGNEDKLFEKPKILFPDHSDDLVEANDFTLIQHQKNEFIIVAEPYKNAIVLFDHSTNRISQWTRPGFNPMATCSNPNQKNGFLVLDRRKNNKSWLYLFSTNGDSIKKEYVWLDTIPVSSQNIKPEIGLSCVINPSIPENTHIAIGCIKNKEILEYLWVKGEDKLLPINSIVKFDEKSIAPTDLSYKIHNNKIHLYIIDDSISLKQLY